MTLEEIKAELESRINDESVDFANDYEASYDDYICDAISEWAYNCSDGGWCALCDWLKVNYEWVEEALFEFGVPKKQDGQPDIERLLRMGQYLNHEHNLYDDLENIVKLIAVNYLIDKKIENGAEVFEKIEDDLEKIDNNSRFSEIEDLIKENLENGSTNG